MLISLNWIRDFVDLPAGLDPRELAERFTRTTAEVEEVHPLTISAKGLIAARILSATELTGSNNLHVVSLDIGNGKTVETVTAAPVLHVNALVVFAPVGSSIAAYPEITTATVAGRESVGVILPGEALGVAMAAQEALYLDPTAQAGDMLDPALFDDWVIEVDNKSITHRPDLWGHYGIARELAAIYGCPLKPYPVVSTEALISDERPVIPIKIADPNASPRYSCLRVEGVPTQPAPLWMQLRVGHIGLRPISGLVDLSNYIMAELGQPMHAFDADKVARIEVDYARDGEKFTTLDGMERLLTPQDLMIQCEGRSIALAGVMGGLESEVSDTTVSLLLESANFNATTIRKTTSRLSLRTDASARFEKSLDPTHTVLAIQRFLELAKSMYTDLRYTSTLSDAFESPPSPLSVTVHPAHVARALGREISTPEMTTLLEPLGFAVRSQGALVEVDVPTFRATGDVSIEADVIEEVARFIGYNNIEPVMPRVTARRFAPHALHDLEQRTLGFFTGAHGYNEIHGYLWYDAAWLAHLGVNPGPCVELVNPAAEGLHQFRKTLLPGLLASLEKNRFHFPVVKLLELGSVFEPQKPDDLELRHIGMISACKGKNAEEDLLANLKGAIENWAWSRFSRPVSYRAKTADTHRPWEHPQRTVTVVVGDVECGRLGTLPSTFRRTMDEHLGSWSVAWAELQLTGLECLDPADETLGSIPQYPLVDLDFSVVVQRSVPFEEVTNRLNTFQHPLLKHVHFMGSYEGDAIEDEKRSLTFRLVVGRDDRTLVDADTAAFRSDFEKHLKAGGFEIRR